MVAVVFGVVAVWQAGPWGEPAVAAGPPPLELEYASGAEPAARILRELAVGVGTRADEATDRYEHVTVAQWSLDMAASRVAGTTTTVVPQLREVWRAADGSGRTTLASLRSALPDPGSVREQAADALSVLPESRVVTDYAAGELEAVLPQPVPDTVAGLAEALYAGHPRENGPTSAVRAVAGLYQTAAVRGEVRAMVLEFLATVEEVVYRGAVRDRLGRTGVAVSVDSDGGGTRDILVIDERTGALLAYESMFLKRPPKLSVRVPAVFSYVLYLGQDWRPTTS